MLRRSLVVVAVLAAALAVAPFAAAAVGAIRVEGKTVTLFGPSEPRVFAATPLEALQAASRAAELYVHVASSSFGNYVDQVGLYGRLRLRPAGLFKVNGVSPPVGTDQVQLKDGDVVEWYYATFGPTGGPPTLVLKPTAKGCYAATGADDQGAQKVPSGLVYHVDGRTIPAAAGRICFTKRHGLSLGERARRGALEPAAVIRAALVAVVAAALLAGCGGGGAGRGTATLWLTRDEGKTVLLVRSVPAGESVLQALERSAKISTRYGGRFVQSVNGLSGSITSRHDWFYYVNGIEGDRSGADYRLRDGDIAWWDYRDWGRRA